MATVGLDVDGVLANLIQGTLDWLVQQGHPRRHHDDVTMYDFHKELLTVEESKAAITRWSFPEFWASLPVYPGAVEAVAELRAHGHDVVFVTAPWSSCRGWYDARLDWLRRHFAVNDPRHNLQHDFYPVDRKHRVRVDALVEDKPGNLDTWLAANPGGAGFLYPQKYNAGPRLHQVDVRYQSTVLSNAYPRVTWLRDPPTEQHGFQGLLDALDKADERRGFW